MRERRRSICFGILLAALMVSLLALTFLYFAWSVSDRLVCVEPLPTSVTVNGSNQVLSNGCYSVHGPFGSQTIDATFPNGVHRRVLLKAHPTDDQSTCISITPHGVETHGFDIDVKEIEVGTRAASSLR